MSDTDVGDADAAPTNRLETIVDEASMHDSFREDVLSGLSLEQKAISPKHLYDARGSDLFDRICDVEDYYPTRTEASIFDESLDDIAAHIGPDAVLIEPGVGSGEKAHRLLGALERPRAFVPVEISPAALEPAADAIASAHPETEIVPICTDFTRGLELPENLPRENRVIFFPGSTLGNFDPDARTRLLDIFGRAVGSGGLVLIGVDLEKDVDVLEAAYDDSEGLTAEFNLNLLTRINRELGGTFDLDDFGHDAPWLPERSQIQMRLVSQRDHDVTVGGRSFSFREGEWIHTESSNKFSPEEIDRTAREAGLAPVKAWMDGRSWFRLGLYRVV